MRNNIVKKIPKNFENAYVAMQYQSQDDEVVKLVRKRCHRTNSTRGIRF